MPYVYKSFPVEVLDKFFTAGPNLGDAYEYSLGLLSRDGATLKDVTEQHSHDARGRELEAVIPQADLFDTVWLTGMPFAHVDAIMRVAYEKAIRLAMEGSELKPIETFWVTGTGPAFEMHISATDRRVTVFVFTPIQRRHPGSRTAVSQSWAIRADQEGNVTVEQVSGKYRELTGSEASAEQ